MSAPTLTPTSGGFALSLSPTSVRKQLPTAGAPTFLAVTNLSPDWYCFVALGDNTVVADETGVAVSPKSTVFLTIGSNTYLAGVTLQGLAAVSVTPST